VLKAPSVTLPACRCPIGGMNGLFAKLSMTELRARQGVLLRHLQHLPLLKVRPPRQLQSNPLGSSATPYPSYGCGTPSLSLSHTFPITAGCLQCHGTNSPIVNMHDSGAALSGTADTQDLMGMCPCYCCLPACLPACVVVHLLLPGGSGRTT